VYPDWITVALPARGFFAGRSAIGHKGLVKTDARKQQYAVVYLFDPRRSQAATGSGSFLTGGPMNMAPYTARLRVQFIEKRPPNAFGPFLRGCLIPGDFTRFNNFLRSMAWAKSARDKVLVDTRCHEPIKANGFYTAGDGIRCGAFVARRD